MNVYLAGPMRGILDFNFPAFHAAAQRLRRLGHTVFSPAERDELQYGVGTLRSADGDLRDIPQFNLRGALAEDTQWICLTADAIAMLPGWKSSLGARAEKVLAEALGLEVLYL